MNDAGSQVRRFGESIRARARGERAARGRLPGRLREPGSPSGSRARPTPTPDELARRGIELMLERDRAPRSARFRVDVGPLLLGARAARVGRGRRGARAARRRAVYDVRGRAVAAHHRLRRRQGPRAAALHRRAHLLRRRTSPTTPDKRGARLRPPDQRARAPTTTATWRGCRRPGQALGGDPERLEIVIMQLVNLAEGGERAQMSKRAGASSCTLDDLLDDIGVDAARWFLAPAQPRHHDRPRPRPGPRASPRTTPSTTCSTRTRGSPGSCARPARSGSRRAGGGPERQRRALPPVGALARQAAAGASRPRCATRPSAARRTA